MDVSHLLRRCREGDPAAVEALVHAHQNAVYRLAYALLGDPAEADDAAQEALLAALRSLDTYRGDSAFSTWLYSVTANVCRLRRRRWRTLGRLREQLTALFWQNPAPPQPEAAVVQAETDAALWRAVQALGEKHRAPVVLRYYYGCSVDEIARILDLKPGTVHSRLSIARDRLRAVLQSAPAGNSVT